ncbi:hypothetical protein PMJ10TS2_60980 [Paenibacillus melissococcoides]
MFCTKADDLVVVRDKISPYARTWEASAGGSYVFPEIGLAFYRSNSISKEELGRVRKLSK